VGSSDKFGNQCFGKGKKKSFNREFVKRYANAENKGQMKRVIETHLLFLALEIQTRAQMHGSLSPGPDP
jgi:hypothetical protein